MTEASSKLARLEPVALRTVWPDEAGDFTPWLAEPANLGLLGETLGLQLEDAKTEVEVGNFYADVIATNAADNRRVLIENQLARTDHGHLGQILTYAAGLDALTVVWIAKRFTDEHRAALEWLNNHTNEEIGFFGLELELWKIGDSPCAPKFNVVAKPNEWTKSTPSDGPMSPLEQARLEFWKGFVAHADGAAKHVRPGGASPRHWLAFYFGRGGFYLQAIASTYGEDKEPEIRAELLIRDGAQHFSPLQDAREEIEADLVDKPTWFSEEGTLQARIYYRKSVDWQSSAKRIECYEWLVAKLDRLHAVFRPRILELP